MSSSRPNVIARICPCIDQSCLTVDDAEVSVPQHKVTVPLTAVFEEASQSQMYDAVSETVNAAAEEGLNATILTYVFPLMLLRLSYSFYMRPHHVSSHSTADTAKLVLERLTRCWGSQMHLESFPERLKGWAKLSKTTAA